MNKLSQRQRSIIMIIIMLSAIFWIALILKDSISQLPTSLSAMKLAHITMASLPAMVSVFIASYIYFLILAGIFPVNTSFYSVALPFFAAQAVRYLPGRIWGIFYLAQATAGWLPARYAVRANIVHFALTALNSIAVALSVYAYYHRGIALALMTYTVLLLFVYAVSKNDLLQRAAAVITPGTRHQGSNNRKDLLLLGLLQTDWLFFLIACKLMLPQHFSPGDSLIIATSYAVAWLAGALAFMLPGGLFVREGSFLWLSSIFGFNPADMFLFSIVARILFALSDVICATAGIALMRLHK